MNYCHSCGRFRNLTGARCNECAESFRQQYARAQELDLGFDAAGYARGYGRYGSRDLVKGETSGTPAE